MAEPGMDRPHALPRVEVGTVSVETRTFVSTCAGTKFGSCGARAEWDVISTYTNLDNALGGPDYEACCDAHLAYTVREVLTWHHDSAVTVEPTNPTITTRSVRS